MITQLTLENFKSFGGHHKVPLGPLSLIVGTNASGKSNLRDALRLLHGVGRGYTLAEILGEKYGEGGVLIWKGLRGGPRELVHDVNGGRLRLGCELTRQIKLSNSSSRPPVMRFCYDIELEVATSGNKCFVIGESLWAQGNVVFSTAPNILRAGQPEDGQRLLARISKRGSKKFIGPTLMLHNNQPLLSQLAGHPDATLSTITVCRALLASLASMRFLDLDPQALRRPSLPGQDVLGDKGENLSSVLQALCEDPASKEAFIEWTRELTPLDVEGFEFRQVSLDGKIQLALRETDGRLITAESASDGTLRFLAYAAALLGVNPAAVHVFEEIENGIHPNRVHLLLEMLRQATAEGRSQVIATTHSPALLNSLRGDSLKQALLVTRSGPSSRTRTVGSLPVAEKDQSLAGDLLESGWFENISAFLEADEIGKDASL